MRSCLLAAAAFCAAAPAHSAVLLTEIVDGPLGGGAPRFFEITNTGTAAVDLSAYSVAAFANGSPTINRGGGVALQLSGTLGAGASVTVAAESAEYAATYGVAPDFLSEHALLNGDDAVGLFLGLASGDGSDATLVDVFGVIGQDGTLQPWEYLDGYAYRAPEVTVGATVFDAAQWVFSGRNALDGATAAQIAAVTSAGTHAFESATVVPLPASGLLGLVGVAALAGMRRRR